MDPNILQYLQGRTGGPPVLAQPPSMAGPLPSLGSPAMPSVLKAPDPAVANTQSRLLGDQGELQRLKSTGDGISQIQNPILHGLARTGNVIESILAPRAAQFTPGTAEHHQMLLGQATGNVNNDLANEQTQANTTLLDAQPQLKQMAAENNMMKTQGLLGHYQDQAGHWDDQTNAVLSKAGYKHDASGALVPMSYEEMAPQQQGFIDYKAAMEEKAKAQSELVKAQKDNIPAQMALKREAIAAADRHAMMASQRMMGRAVQVVDPNDPNSTVYMSAGQAMQSGAHGTQGINFQTQKALQKDFTSGHDSNTLNAINTAYRHMDNYEALAKAMNNGDVKAINQMANTLGVNVQNGASPQVVSGLVKEALKGEMAKAFTGAGATVDEQRNLDSSFSNANSMPTMLAVAKEARTLLKGKQDALHSKYDAGKAGTPDFIGTSPTHSGGSMVRARDPQGKLHEAPAGTPLPAGWKAE